MTIVELSAGQKRAAPLSRRPAGPDFIEAAARLAGAVAIVAGQDEAGPFGLLVSSLTVLSVEPPRVLFCARKAASCHPRLLGAEALSIAVLGAEHERDAQRFAAPALASERFAPDRWSVPRGAPPRFHGGLLSIEGEISERIGAETHTVFILDVIESEVRESEPLLYFNRRFRRLSRGDRAAAR